jgi:tRNA A-37 threonylcarbamoyl transferase component Bud32
VNPDQAVPDDDSLEDLLVSYDEALARGDTIEMAVATPPNQEPDARLVRLQACLRRLELDRRARQLRVSAQTPAPAEGTLPAAPRLQQVGRFAIVRLLGGGGHGIVYLVTDSSLKRDVALKMPRPEAFFTPELRSRFVREGQAIARLKHPNLVEVYEAGEANTIPYLVSEFCSGGSLADWLRSRRGSVDPKQAVELVWRLAAAVQYMHDNQVIHRDLKPGNILFDSAGVPKITDFGLAKLTEPGWTQTQSDAVLGTASYMAPEQAVGKTKTVGPLADVYALGVILYELLIGAAPFRGATVLETLEQVRTQEPVKLRAKNAKVPRDLENICLKCLEKKPEWRYASAAALGVDLKKWLDGEPLQPESLPRRAWRWVRRRPRQMIAAGLVFLAVGIAFSVARYVHPDPDRLRKEMEAKLARGEAVTLIGETGMPLWSRWLDRKGIVDSRSEREEGPFAFEGETDTLLELCHNPQISNYIFEADIWQKSHRSGEFGVAGLYFLHEQQNNDHSCCALCFSEFAHEFRDNPATAQVKLAICARRDDLRDAMTMHAVKGLMFEPARGDMVWRHLRVEVRPLNIRAFWGRELIGEATREELHREFPFLLASSPEFRSMDPGFPAQPALGIFLSNAAAAFRNIKICPLPPEF